MVAVGSETNLGTNAQRIVFAVMVVSCVCFWIAGVTRPLSKRLPYYVNVAIMMIAATAYYAMFVDTTNPTTGRKDIYARYLDWVLTTPLLLFDLMLMVKMPASKIAYIMGADVAMVVLGLIGSFDESNYKWYYFAVSCVLMIALMYGMIESIYTPSEWKEPEVEGLLYIPGYMTLLIYLIVLWVLYPIVWGLGTGAGVISTDIEIILMGILDILAKPLFAVGVLITHETIFHKIEVLNKGEQLIQEAA
eukprot:TRINITY_DN1514_c1_g2_i2.p1 TRINITY_DN1514_c1_g2~~TRINITY_DN1514_c1_g2_i2.p1  ORF type:complete len:285 (-),score=51.34 TRINITY_DN1514_c1_g2_i2:302-1045(-)